MLAIDRVQYTVEWRMRHQREGHRYFKDNGKMLSEREHYSYVRSDSKLIIINNAANKANKFMRQR